MKCEDKRSAPSADSLRALRETLRPTGSQGAWVIQRVNGSFRFYTAPTSSISLHPPMLDPAALPALATAHSHAFQRALRGDTQRPGPEGTDDFWSWRVAMYRLADSLTPESIHAISLAAYRELFRAGVRTVGE